MVKFMEVKDLEKVKEGDIVVFPADELRLNVSVATFARMGLSVGDTCRSENFPAIVDSWLVRKDMKPRAFMVVDPSYMRSETDDELLLGLDAVSSRKREDPTIRQGALVPFGTALWPMRTWAACWNKTHGGIVQGRLLTLMGAAGAVRVDERLRAAPDDLCMNQVWDGLLSCSGRPADAQDAYQHVPVVLCNELGATINSYKMGDLMGWGGSGRDCKRSRIRFSSVKFMRNLGRRGAKAIRPTEQFVDDVTDSIAEWMCAEIAKRFAQRTEAGKRFMEGLAADVKRDGSRVKAYKAAARKLAPRTKAARKAMLSGTGVEL